MSANYRCSPPSTTHQQYLDINRRKKERKKHNQQAK
jgi:hypothetical protein